MPKYPFGYFYHPSALHPYFLVLLWSFVLFNPSHNPQVYDPSLTVRKYLSNYRNEKRGKRKERMEGEDRGRKERERMREKRKKRKRIIKSTLLMEIHRHY